MINVNELIKKAYTFHQSGNLEAAAALYNNILKIYPDHIEANSLMGTLNLQKGDLVSAAVFLEKAIELKPDHLSARNNLGNVLQEQGKLNEAAENYRLAIKIKPDYERAHSNLAALLQKSGKLDEAIESYRLAIKYKPDYAMAHNNLGNVLQEQGKHDEAAVNYNRALKIDPNYAEAQYNLGALLQKQGKLNEALSYFQKALMLKPNYVNAYYSMGNVLTDLGKLDEALSSYHNALRLKPDFAIEVKVALLLPAINESNESIKQYRKTILERIESMKSKGLTLEDPYGQIGSTNFYLVYHGLNDKEIQNKIASFYIHVCPDLAWSPPVSNKERQKHDKIKIGLISNFLHNHTIGKLNRGIIKYLSREKFHVIVFRFLGGKEDHVSNTINSDADEVVILPKELGPARQEIAEKSLDVLYYLDIGMDPFTYFLAFSRLAPVQCVTFGHPVTTGIPNMDYFISSKNSEPSDPEDHYSERLFLLNKLPVYYYRPNVPKGLPSREKYGLPKDYKLYVCPQTLFKFHPDFDVIIGDILRKDPHGLLVLIEGKRRHYAKLLRERLARTIPDVVGRVRFLPSMHTSTFLSLLMIADAVLDTPFFGGGNTSLEAFACGVPIVTMPGQFMRDRLTFDFYMQMGIMDCVAKDAQSYVDIAFKIANNVTWRDEIKDKIRSHANILYENIEAVHELERFFKFAYEESNKKNPVSSNITTLNDSIPGLDLHNEEKEEPIIAFDK